GDCRTKESIDALQVGMFRECRRQGLNRLRKPPRIGVCTRLHVDLETACAAETAYRRRIERKHDAIGESESHPRYFRCELRRRLLADVPVLEQYEARSGVGLVAAA